jgi:hypothetical protein
LKQGSIISRALHLEINIFPSSMNEFRSQLRGRVSHASPHNGGNPNGQFAQVGKAAHATVLRKRLARLEQTGVGFRPICAEF